MELIKIGTTELTREEAEKFYSERKYICNYSGIWRIDYSVANSQFYGRKVINYKGYAPRGRFYAHNAKTINHILGEKLLNED